MIRNNCNRQSRSTTGGCNLCFVNYFSFINYFSIFSPSTFFFHVRPPSRSIAARRCGSTAAAPAAPGATGPARPQTSRRSRRRCRSSVVGPQEPILFSPLTPANHRKHPRPPLPPPHVLSALVSNSPAFNELMKIEQKLDWTLMRKKAEVNDALGRPTRVRWCFITRTLGALNLI